MKQLKFVLWTLFVAVYTSGWWSLAFWGGHFDIKTDGALPLAWVLMVLIGISIVIAAIGYLINNWHKE